MPHRDTLRIRDPYVLPHEGKYLLFGTTDTSPWSGPGGGFDHYVSDDLEWWDGPFPSFRPSDGFWGKTQFWAPEVHEFGGRWWMFATFADGHGARGTQILTASGPREPFEPWSDGPVTPRGWMCLDGTLHVDDDQDPWIVFCHEWLQADGEGAIHAQRLSQDLRTAVGEPVLLFRASEAPWVRPFVNTDTGFEASAFITDGPYVFRRHGRLSMLWSSGGDSGYAVGLATSESGTVLGPWKHHSVPLVREDGGHAMILDPSGPRPLVVFHQPNELARERLTIQSLSDLALVASTRPGDLT